MNNDYRRKETNYREVKYIFNKQEIDSLRTDTIEEMLKESDMCEANIVINYIKNLKR
jgi:hypothetical protein